MTQFDFFILAIMGLSVLFAWIRGLSREVSTLVAIGIGIGALALFGDSAAGMAGDSTLGPIIAYGLVFLVGFGLGSILLEMLTSKFFGQKPSMTDKLAGAVFGLVRGWLIVGLAFLALTYYFDEDDMPEPIDNASLKALVTSGASILEGLGLQSETSGPESPDTEEIVE